MVLGRRTGMLRASRTHEPDLVCFSHLRWNFVFQRPQHLMTRCARDRRVFFIEEPLYSAGITPRMHITPSGAVQVAVPHLPEGITPEDTRQALRALVDDLIATRR